MKQFFLSITLFCLCANGLSPNALGAETLRNVNSLIVGGDLFDGQDVTISNVTIIWDGTFTKGANNTQYLSCALGNGKEEPYLLHITRRRLAVDMVDLLDSPRIGIRKYFEARVSGRVNIVSNGIQDFPRLEIRTIKIEGQTFSHR